MAQVRPGLYIGSSPISNPRSVTRTLRIDEDVEAEVAEMAGKEQLSFNLLANRALRKLVEWENKAEKFGFIQFPASAFEKLFSNLSDEEARDLGRHAGENVLPEMILFWFKKFDQNTILKTLELIAGYGKSFKMEHIIDGGCDIVVLKHDRGPRVSAYYAELLKSVYKPLSPTVEIHETQDQVVANITNSFTGPSSKPAASPEVLGSNGNGHGANGHSARLRP